MADQHIDQVLAALSATFDGVVERAEEDAAADLAGSLAQDQPLDRYLAGSGAVDVRWSTGCVERVTCVGIDYVATAGRSPIVVPLRGALLVRRPVGDPPAFTRDRLVHLLRTWAREHGQVRVGAGSSDVEGLLVKAGEDHVAVGTLQGEVVVPLSMVSFVRRLRRE